MYQLIVAYNGTDKINYLFSAIGIQTAELSMVKTIKTLNVGKVANRHYFVSFHHQCLSRLESDMIEYGQEVIILRFKKTL